MREDLQPKLQLAANWTLVSVFLFFPVVFALGNVLIALALVLSLLAGNYRARWETIKGVPVVWWALGLYAMVLLGVTYSPAPSADVQLHLSKYSKLLWIPVLLSLLPEAQWRRRCLWAFMAAMGFIMLSAFANVFWQLPWSRTQEIGWGKDHTVIGDYITQNIMMTFFVVAAMDLGRRTQSLWQRYAWWIAALMGAVVVTQLSQGRTGYVLLILSVGTYIFWSLQGRRRWLTLLSLSAVLVVALASSQTVRQRIDLAITEAAASDTMEITSIGGRVNFWKHTWTLVTEKPLQGWGTGSYHSVWCEYVTQPGWCQFGSWHPHNQYLFFWMENGLLGVVLFVLLATATIWAARKAPVKDRAILWAFAAILAGNSLINSPLFSGRESHFFVLMLILLCAQAKFGPQEKAEQPEGAAAGS